MSFGIKRKDLQALAEAKIADAVLLLHHGRFGNAYYLAGHAVELGFKAAITLQFAAETLPDPKLVRTVYTHALRELVGIAGFTAALKAKQDENRQVGTKRSTSMAADTLVAPDVEGARTLISLLDSANSTVRSSLWVFNPEVGTWRLWLTFRDRPADKREFYQKIGDVISANRSKLAGLDVGDIELVEADHPVLVGMRKLIRIDGLGSTARFANNMFSGYFLPDSIVLRMT